MDHELYEAHFLASAHLLPNSASIYYYFLLTPKRTKGTLQWITTVLQHCRLVCRQIPNVFSHWK